MKRFTVMIIAILAIIMFTIPTMAGERTETVRYECAGIFECKVIEVRDTRGALGYRSWDDWRYKSTDGHRYEIEVDWLASKFHNCGIGRHAYKVTTYQQEDWPCKGDWPCEGIRVYAMDRMKPWGYSLKVKHKKAY
jgi:hypothetical protein